MAARFELFKDTDGQFRFHLKAANGQIIAASEGYKTRAGATAAPATPATKKQSLTNSVKRLRVGRTALLPNRTDQGLPIRSWDNVTPRTCRLLRRDDAFRIRGLHSGRCRLKVTAAAGSGYSPFTSVLSVRVTAA